MTYVPYVGLTRSQSLRLGRGPGSTVVTEANFGDTAANVQSGALSTVFYANLNNSEVRRDIQRHSTLGAIDSVGAPSNTVYSDLFKVDGLGLTPSGSSYNVAVAAGTIQSRFYGTRLGVAAQTVTLPSAPAVGGQTNWVCVNSAGVASVVAGAVDSAASTYEVWSITAASATAGTFVLQFTYNGFLFTTGAIAYNALGTAVATAINAATGGPGTSDSFSQFIGGAGGAVGAGTTLPGGPATVTFSGAAEGPVVPASVDNSQLTGGAGAVIVRTVGTGGQSPFPANYLVLGGYYVATANANAAAATVIGNTVLTA